MKAIPLALVMTALFRAGLVCDASASALLQAEVLNAQVARRAPLFVPTRTLCAG